MAPKPGSDLKASNLKPMVSAGYAVKRAQKINTHSITELMGPFAGKFLKALGAITDTDPSMSCGVFLSQVAAFKGPFLTLKVSLR